jgi:hypothetical protein
MNQTNNIISENSNMPSSASNADSDLNPVSLRQRVVESDGEIAGTTNINMG